MNKPTPKETSEDNTQKTARSALDKMLEKHGFPPGLRIKPSRLVSDMPPRLLKKSEYTYK